MEWWTAAETAYLPVELPRKDCTGCCVMQTPVKGDVAEADGGEAVNLKEVNEVAAAPLVDAKVDAFGDS
eukprot:776958-Pleurochrysis_carterae.AAC.1